VLQNEPFIAVHPANANVIAAGVGDVRTVGISADAWQAGVRRLVQGAARRSTSTR
jgi:hypothetical protein